MSQALDETRRTFVTLIADVTGLAQDAAARLAVVYEKYYQLTMTAERFATLVRDGLVDTGIFHHEGVAELAGAVAIARAAAKD